MCTVECFYVLLMFMVIIIATFISISFSQEIHFTIDKLINYKI